MSKKSLFFPILKRRQQYRTKRNGEYYAKYEEYKQEIREDCLGRCVYCDSHENELGGASSMNLDHFRPKKYPQFKHLKNDPHNLVWSCRACNRAKFDYWPALGTNETIVGQEGFIDPFIEDRRHYFDVSINGKLVALKSPAKYMIVLLSLNRVHAKRIRKMRLEAYNIILKLNERISELEQQVDLTTQQQKGLELLRQSRAGYQKYLDFRLY